MAAAKHISASLLGSIDEASFWALVRRGSAGECWPWTGTVNGKGYGRYTIGADEMRAHRVAFALGKNTPLPGVVMVCHRCDNPSCCNPGHLFIGLAEDNNRDAASKGRATAPRGLANGNGKLSGEQVLEISASAETGAAIARRLGVSQALVSMIRRGKRRQMVGDTGVEPVTFRV